MKRLRQWLFNLAAAVSLVLCVAVIVFWVRSFGGLEAIVSEDGSRLMLASGKGEAALFVRRYPRLLTIDWHVNRFGSADAAGRLLETRVAPGSTDTTTGACLGAQFWLQRIESPPTVTIVAGVVPYWMLTAASGLFPLLCLGKRIRRRPSGTCPTCGYDLRATPERCPECGMIPFNLTEATR